MVKGTVLVINLDSFSAPFHYILGQKMKRKGYVVKYVTYSNYVESYLKKRGVTDVVNIRKSLQSFGVLKNDRKKIEQEYGITFYQFIRPDRGSYFKSKKKNIIETIQYFKFYKNYFERNKIDYIYTQIGGERTRRIGKLVGDSKGIPTILFSEYGILDVKGQFNSIFLDNEMNRWVNPELVRKKLTTEEKNRAEEYIKEFTTEKKIMFGRAKILDFEKFKKFFLILWRWVWYERFSYEYSDPIVQIRIHIPRFVKAWLTKKYYKYPAKDEKYVFFPLHHPDDSQITVRALKYIQQDRVVEKVARQLPKDMKLYVKEHPHQIGRMAIKAIRRMTSIPNVRLVPWWLNAHELLLGAEFPLVINSSVGWEAILHGKKSVVLAPVFYRGFGVTVDNEDINKLHEDFDRLKKMKISRIKVLGLINGVLNSSFRSDIYIDFYRNLDERSLNECSDEIVVHFDRMVDLVRQGKPAYDTSDMLS